MRDPDDHPSRAELSADAHQEGIEAAVARYFRWRTQWQDPESGPYDGGEVEFVTEMFTAMLDAYLEALNAH